MAAPSRRMRIPELDRFLLSNVESTGVEIGNGAYGRVEEVKIPGATCAAKMLHEELLRMGSNQQVREWTSTFVRECTLMSQLRHPHIVQFLGIFFQPGSRLPLLVMERLITNLDTVLETTPNIPLDIKRSVLLDVARGLTFLHSHSPPIIHRDLTARNVLLNSAMVAKIADLGVARIVNIRPGQLAATMTRAPGNAVYMPPEAMEEPQSRYSTAIDVFSYGNLALFTLTQDFPELKAPTYVDPRSRRIVGRSEIERRMDYFEKLYRDFGEQHPIVRLVDQCLQNIPEDRPSISRVVEQLLLVNSDRNWDMTKLELVRDIVEKEKVTEDQQLEIDRQKELVDLQRFQLNDQSKYFEEQISEKDDIIRQKNDIIRQKDDIARNRIQVLEEQIREKDDIIRQMDDRNRNQVEELKEQIAQLQLHLFRALVPGNQVAKKQVVVPTPVSIEWRKCRCVPYLITSFIQPVVHDGKVYTYHGIHHDMIIVYTPERDEWTELPRLPGGLNLFTLASVNHQLVAVGGRFSDERVSDKIVVWDSRSQKWLHPYPAMSTPRYCATAIGYQHYLIVASDKGEPGSAVIEILDTTNSQWYVAESLPQMKPNPSRPALVNDILYLVEHKKAVFKASIPALIARATSGTTQSTATIWERLPDTPLVMSSPVIINDHLLVVGGLTDDIGESNDIHFFNPVTKQWLKVGELPVELSMMGFGCTSLPSGELMMVSLKMVYIGTVTIH